MKGRKSYTAAFELDAVKYPDVHGTSASVAASVAKIKPVLSIRFEGNVQCVVRYEKNII